MDMVVDKFLGRSGSILHDDYLVVVVVVVVLRYYSCRRIMDHVGR